MRGSTAPLPVEAKVKDNSCFPRTIEVFSESAEKLKQVQISMSRRQERDFFFFFSFSTGCCPQEVLPRGLGEPVHPRWGCQVEGYSPYLSALTIYMSSVEILRNCASFCG